MFSGPAVGSNHHERNFKEHSRGNITIYFQPKTNFCEYEIKNSIKKHTDHLFSSNGI